MANNPESLRKLAVGAGGFVALLGIFWAIWASLPPPQLPADEQVFNTVDALFTALTARDSKRLAECEQRLKSYHSDRKTSDAVAARLDSIISLARDGQWEPAARNLYDFMLGQRGEGVAAG